jgi:hypothetical protein
MGSRRKPYRSKSKQSKARSSWQPVAIGGVIVLGVVALGALLFLNLRGSATAEAIEGLIRFGRQERGHTEALLPAADLPPVGGTHSPVWQNCGIYDKPIPTENAVHSLEHGAVWVAYQPELPAADIEALQQQAQGERYLLLSPYPGLRSPVVLTAWQVQLELDSVGDERVWEFIDEYRQGPTTPEPGASCQDGVGTPLQ